jgi:hypothetical protein
MPSMQIKALSSSGIRHTWVLDFGGDARDYFVRLVAPDDGEWEARGADLFFCLQTIRRQIEPNGWKLCVNGARRNAYPSRLSCEVSGGYWVYVLRRWWPARKVFIFGSAPTRSIATVSEQNEYYERWRKWIVRGEGTPRL